MGAGKKDGIYVMFTIIAVVLPVVKTGSRADKARERKQNCECIEKNQTVKYAKMEMEQYNMLILKYPQKEGDIFGAMNANIEQENPGKAKTLAAQLIKNNPMY